MTQTIIFDPKQTYGGYSLPVAGKKAIVVTASWEQVVNEIKPWIKEQGFPLINSPFRVGRATDSKWAFKFVNKDDAVVFKLTWGGTCPT